MTGCLDLMTSSRKREGGGEFQGLISQLDRGLGKRWVVVMGGGGEANKILIGHKFLARVP